MKRLYWMLCLSLVLVTSGCKSGQGKADSDNAEQSVRASVELPFEIPEDTVMLLRSDLRQLEHAYPHGDELARLVASTQSARGADAIPTLNAPAKLSLAWLMTYPYGLSGSIDDPENVPEAFFDGLADDGTVYAAISLAGNGPLMQALEHHVPMTGTQTIPRGFFVRLSLPADDPAALAAWLEAACDERMLRCGGEYAVEAREDTVVFDFRKGDVESIFERSGVSADLPEVGDDPKFLQGATPALRAFVNTEAAMGIYVKSERLAALGAYVGMTEAFGALEYAAAGNRARLYSRGMEVAGQSFELISSEAREVSDSTFMLQTSEEFGFHVDFVASLTELGAKVSEAGHVKTTGANVETEGMFEAQFAYDVAGSRKAAVTPEWMRGGTEEDARRVAKQLRSGGIWTYLVGVHNYPAGFSRGLSSLAVSAGGEQAVISSQLEYLKAARISLKTVQSTSTPLGLEPRGGLVVVFDGRADLEGYLERGRAQLERAPFPIELKLVERDGLQEVRLLFGSNVSVGEPTEIPSVLQASLDLAALGVSATKAGAESRRAAMVAERFGPILDKIGTMETTTSRGDAVVHARMTIGRAEAPAYELPQNATPVAQSESRSGCLVEARRESASALSANDEVDPDRRADFARDVFEALGEAKADCPEHADVLDWMSAQWLRRAGIVEANGLSFERAKKDFEKACELDATQACPLLERAEEPGLNAEFAEVKGPVSTWTREDSGYAEYTVVRPGEVASWTFVRPLGLGRSTSHDTSSVDWADSSVRQNLAELLRRPNATEIRVIVDRNAEAYGLAVMAQEAGKDRSRQRRIMGSNGRQPGLLVPVKVEGRPELGLLRFVLPGDDEQAMITLRLDKNGVSFASSSSEPESIEDLSSTLGQIDAETLTGQVDIVVSQGVRFSEVAQLAAELQRVWATADKELSIVLTIASP